MLLKKLIFNNYKTYYGHQEIDLYIPEEIRVEKKQNIILLGGLNGAGKTTILKAILYILFGKRGVSESEYKRIFSNIINNTFFDEGGRECSVSLTLETDSQEDWTIKIKWYFDNFKRMTHEERKLEIKKHGTKFPKHARIDNIEAYNRFIDRIIPFYAAPFFIFDGEEIKDIILRQNKSEMKEAIHKITGMDAYKQLINDLRRLQSTLENKLAKSVSQKQLASVQSNLSTIKQTIVTLESKRDKHLAEIRKYDTLIKEAKLERNNKFLQNSKSREAIIKRQSSISTELELTKKELNQFLTENITSIILRDKIQNLKKRLKHENEVNHRRILQKSSLTPYYDFMNKLLDKNITPPLTQLQLEQIKTIGEEIWMLENNLRYDVPKDFIEIHDISNSDFNYLMNFAIKDKAKAISLVNKIEKYQQELNDLEMEIRNAPESVSTDEENNKIDLLVRKTGEINLRLKSVNSKLNTANEEKTQLMNNITRLTGQGDNIEELQRELVQIQQIIIAMEQYLSEVTRMKAEYIKEEFSQILTKLFRKQEEFGKIEFDINSYSIRLYNDRLQEISIQDRSAGEMQMISSALIWALTKASDLSLPMVIDTPLGRLDSFHRTHLINHYYKELSEQVIILSTDTEITGEYIDLMKNNSYKQYMLDYDEQKKYTIIRDGYFNFTR